MVSAHGTLDGLTLFAPHLFPLHLLAGVIAIQKDLQQQVRVGDEGLELLPFGAGSRAICVERDAASDAYLHEKVVVEQFKLLQPLFSSNLKQVLISELVGSRVEG